MSSMVTAGVTRHDRRRALRLGSIVAALVALTLLTCAPAGVALAHAEVIEVVPASNSVLAESPSEVTVTFSEAISLNSGSVEVFDDTGETVPSEARIADTTIVIELPEPLADGTYVVAWRVVSADSHPVSGTSVFSVGAPSSGAPVDVDVAPEASGVVSAWRVAAMAATYAGVLASVGLWWYARRWHRLAADLDAELADDDDEGLNVDEPTPPSDPLERPVDTVDGFVDDGIVTALQRVGRWQIGAGLLGVVGILLLLPARVVTIGGGWDALSDGGFISDTLTGPIGLAMLVTIAGAVGLIAFRPSRGGASSIVVGLVFTLAALGGFALEGHTRTKEPAWLIVVSDIVHTSAGAVWIGGVIALALTLRRTRGPWRARIVLDVSSWVLWAVIAVSVTGLVMGMIVLVTFNALADTGYGLALLVKVALVVVLVALGERNRLVLVPAIEQSEMTGDPKPAEWALRGLRRSVFAEVVVFGALLIATGTLVGRSPVIASDAPTTDGEHATSGSAEPATVELSSGVGSVTMTLDPGQVGSNMLMLVLTDTTGAPLTLTEPPTVELREEQRGIGPLTVAAQDVGNTTYHAITDIPFTGSWEVTVRARTGTFDSGVATTTFVVTD
jgi:copper transport protein